MKILFATMPFDGHFNPLTGIAVHLKESGHDVRWLQFQGGHQIPDEVRAALAAFLQGEAVGEAPP